MIGGARSTKSPCGRTNIYFACLKGQQRDGGAQGKGEGPLERWRRKIFQQCGIWRVLVPNATAATRDAVQLPLASSLGSLTSSATGAGALALFSSPLCSLITNSFPFVFNFLDPLSAFLFPRPRLFLPFISLPYGWLLSPARPHFILPMLRALGAAAARSSRDKLLASRAGAPEARNSRDPGHVACALSQRHCRESYLRLRYVG